MTAGLDPSYDARKLKGNPNIALYTRLVEDNGVDFAIQALPPLNTEKVEVKIGNEKKYVVDCLDSEWISSSGKYVSDFEETSKHKPLLFGKNFGRYFISFDNKYFTFGRIF